MSLSSSENRRMESGQPNSAWRKGVLALLSAYLAAKLALLILLAWSTKFVMDEYWLVGRVWLFDTDLYQSVFPPKTLLYAVFYQFAHWLGDGSVQIMQIARLQALAISILGLGLLYNIARNIGRSQLEALFALCAVLAFSSYMERAFMTRPEAPATFLALAALWAATRGRDGFRMVFVAGLLSGLAFLTMQKSAYFNLALGLALVGDGLARRSCKDAVFSGAVLVLGWALMIFGYCLYFTAKGATFGDVVSQVFTGSAGNALRGHTVYENLRVFVTLSFRLNLVQYLVCLIGWLVVAPRILRAPRAERIAWIFTGVIATLVYLHPAPWPYNFIMAIPFLGLWAPVVAQAFVMRNPDRGARIMGTITLVLALSLTRNIAYLENHNQVQNQTVMRAEALLGAGDTYADGIGMLVDRRRAGREGWWARSGRLRILDDADRGDFEAIDMVFAESPKVWILSYRTDALAKVLAPYFANAYVAIFPNILISGTRLLPNDETAFEARWPGKYNLYHQNGMPAQAELQLNGKTLTSPVSLARGTHLLSVPSAAEPLLLLPADITVPFDVTSPPKRMPLFDHVYIYFPE